VSDVTVTHALRVAYEREVVAGRDPAFVQVHRRTWARLASEWGGEEGVRYLTWNGGDRDITVVPFSEVPPGRFVFS